MSKKRLILLTLMLCLLSSLITGVTVYVFANPGPLAVYYAEEGIYPDAPDYTISVEGSTYYAKDAYGHIPGWGITSNATNLIQTAINNGQTVKISNGTYALDSPLFINKSYFQLRLDVYADMGFNGDDVGAEYCLTIGHTSYQHMQIFVEGGTWRSYGGWVQKGFFHLVNTKSVFFDKVEIRYSSLANTWAINQSNSHQVYYEKVSIYNVQNGIVLCDGGYCFIEDSYVNAWDYGNISAASNWGVRLDNGGFNARDTSFEGGTGANVTGVYIASSIASNFVADNCGWEYDTWDIDVNITNTAYNYRHSIRGGIVDPTKILDPNDQMDLSLWNKGYPLMANTLTFNGGSATGSSPITVDHDLYTTPDWVVCTVNSNDPSITCTATVNATHILIYHSSGAPQTIFWYTGVYSPSS